MEWLSFWDLLVVSLATHMEHSSGRNGGSLSICSFITVKEQGVLFFVAGVVSPADQCV